ncbi:periplasmic chaperone for outer membrane proteins SurA [Plasticicumulans lactativorans]|uniref:Chaperone SurA n=1 Tax=Plasticicumulans lactativorans TaxID=1133106 RepID=A0A4R2L5W8_9GAMM|nr:peptidylprolyl isomerase [Plasticicumulans lactativorans]TCO82794.1 periplasmic chaperone for outer membrane proteins SurA [Plasticicumulans lactativorans]
MNRPLLVLSLAAVLALPAQAQQGLEFGPANRATPAAGANGGSALDVVVAVVDDDVITRRELDHAVQTTLRQLRQRNTPVPPPQVLEHQVLERQILLLLQQRAAERNGVTVDDQSLNAAIDSIAQRNNMSREQLKRAIERDGYSFAAYQEQVRREMLGARLRQKVVEGRVNVTDQEVDMAMGRGGGLAGGAEPATAAAPAAERELHLAQILVAAGEGASPEQVEAARVKAERVLEELKRGADFRALAVSVSDAPQALDGGDLGWRPQAQIPSAFAEAVGRLQPGQFTDLVRSPSGFHIVKLLEVRSVGEAAGPQQTQILVRHILLRSGPGMTDAQARAQLARLRARALAGEDFAALAREASVDTSSAARGGVLGWVGPKDAPPAFEAAIVGLKPGEISQPVKTNAGWHLVQVMQRRQVAAGSGGSGGGAAGKDPQREQVREALYKRKVEEEWDLWLRRLRDEAYVEIRL